MSLKYFSQKPDRLATVTKNAFSKQDTVYVAVGANKDVKEATVIGASKEFDLVALELTDNRKEFYADPRAVMQNPDDTVKDSMVIPAHAVIA